MSPYAETEADTKAGFCSNCRAGNHNLCASPKCECSDARKHRNRPDYGKVPEVQRPRPVSRLESGPITPAGKAKPAKAVFELVRADPPEPHKAKTTLVEQARPFLEELASEEGNEWYRLVVFPTTTGAGHAKARFVKAYGTKEFEFHAVRLAEANQSAVYVRRVAS